MLSTYRECPHLSNRQLCYSSMKYIQNVSKNCFRDYICGTHMYICQSCPDLTCFLKQTMFWTPGIQFRYCWGLQLQTNKWEICIQNLVTEANKNIRQVGRKGSFTTPGQKFMRRLNSYFKIYRCVLVKCKDIPNFVFQGQELAHYFPLFAYNCITSSDFLERC